MLEEKRIIVTGGSGFLGSHIVDLLKRYNEVFVPRSSDYDLRQADAVAQVFSDFGSTDIVIHAASDVGGIGYNSTHPASQFYNNTLINLNVVHESYQRGVEKIVGIGSVCEYPATTPVPFKEDSLWDGYPVVANDAYSLTKRMLLVQGDVYRRQYGFNAIHLLPVNLYGPRDDFNPSNSHVVPALIHKVCSAIDEGKDSVDVWGTGFESREFLYVADAAKAIVLAAEKYNKPDPVNIGSGQEIEIREITQLIKELTGYSGTFNYLDNGLGGHQRRTLDVTEAEKEFGFVAETDFSEGLKATIDYYLNKKNYLN